MKWTILSIVSVATTAFAAPPSKIARADLEKIVVARQAALPPVDKVKAAECKKYLDAYNKDPEHSDDQVVEAARCFAVAGAIGAAIAEWNLVTRYQPAKRAAMEATRGLASLYERAAQFDRAAEWHENYAGRYGGEKDAKEHLVRAACLRFQLGYDSEANRDVMKLRARDKTVDVATLCDSLHLIEMP
jgi:hypothetical protein